MSNDSVLMSKSDVDALKEFRNMLDSEIVILYHKGFVHYKDGQYNSMISYAAFKDIIQNSFKNDPNSKNLLK